MLVRLNCLIILKYKKINVWKTPYKKLSTINIEWQEVSSIIDNVKKEEKIYLYCRSGNRSQKATDILIKLGYTNVENLGSLSDAAKFLKVKVVKEKN